MSLSSFVSSGVDVVEDGVVRTRRIIDETLGADDAVSVEVPIDVESGTFESVEDMDGVMSDASEFVEASDDSYIDSASNSCFTSSVDSTFISSACSASVCSICFT